MRSGLYSFETERLVVDEWHAASVVGGGKQDLPDVVASLMTESVTRWLPDEWQGDYTRRQTDDWISEPDGEGSTLLAIDRSTRSAVGLVILFESVAQGASGIDVRLGYVIAEAAWGQGFGSELVKGFVEQCRTLPEIRSLIAGVASDNRASIRILEKAGFLPIGDPAAASIAEHVFILELRGQAGPIN